MNVNIYERTHISAMEHEAIQQTFQLPSKYEEESLFTNSELLHALNILTRYNGTLKKKYFNVT